MAAEDLKMNLRFGVGETPEKQAALVHECIDDGAVAIASTLAAPETMATALAEAREAGIPVVTFNSGGSHASAAGSAMHIGLADREGGQRAGEAFNASGVNGTVLCVIHELENQGLEDRCDGLEASYDGEVERLRIGDTGTADIAGSQAAIAQRLAEGDVDGILTLNNDLVGAAIAARGEADVEIASYGFWHGMLASILSRELLFVIYDQPNPQAYLTAATLALIGYSGRFGDVSLLLGGAQILIEPSLYDYERAAGWARSQ